VGIDTKRTINIQEEEEYQSLTIFRIIKRKKKKKEKLFFGMIKKKETEHICNEEKRDFSIVQWSNEKRQGLFDCLFIFLF